MGSKNSDGVNSYTNSCAMTLRVWKGCGRVGDELGIKGAIHKIHTRDRRLSTFIRDVTHPAARYCHVARCIQLVFRNKN